MKLKLSTITLILIAAIPSITTAADWTDFYFKSSIKDMRVTYAGHTRLAPGQDSIDMGWCAGQDDASPKFIEIETDSYGDSIYKLRTKNPENYNNRRKAYCIFKVEILDPSDQPCPEDEPCTSLRNVIGIAGYLIITTYTYNPPNPWYDPTSGESCASAFFAKRLDDPTLMTTKRLKSIDNPNTENEHASGGNCRWGYENVVNNSNWKNFVVDNTPSREMIDYGVYRSRGRAHGESFTIDLYSIGYTGARPYDGGFDGYNGCIAVYKTNGSGQPVDTGTGGSYNCVDYYIQ